MDDFEDKYTEAIEAGEHNLRTIKLLNNWCFYAELARSPGRGMIEAATGLPIGHMGVNCKFSKQGSMLSWLLEDSVYDFYQNNCKSCSDRVPVGFPNITNFVGPREKAAEDRKKQREEQERERKQKQSDRQQDRANLRHELSLEETFVFDLLDELDQDDIAGDDPRLEQLASLAPETFTKKVVQHLLPVVLHGHIPYSRPAAKALLRAQLEPEEKLSVAVHLLSNYDKSSMAIDIVLADAEKLSQDELKKILPRFVSMALASPPGMHVGESTRIALNATPIRTLFHKRSSDLHVNIDELIRDENPQNLEAAIKTILAIDNDELLLKHTRTIFVKLMRRRILLRGERRDSSLLYYLREAASKCFERFPEETDAIIQSYLIGCDDTGKQEAYGTYSSALRFHYNEKLQIETAQRIAFKRLLWAAADSPDNFDDNARDFFTHASSEFAQIAVEHFENLIGAAATLSEKYAQVDEKLSLELPDDTLAQMEKRNKRTAINSLQGSFIEWAAIGAKSKGVEGIKEFLELYRRLPKDQVQMRANMILHISKLLSGVESLTLVLSDWYGALMDESTLIRANAVQAWENVPYDSVKNFPDLFFEAFAVLLSDSYKIVHQSAVHSLRRRPFPEDKRSLIRAKLFNLIVIYSQENKQEEFIVSCIDTFASLCLSPEEKKGKIGKWLSDVLYNLEGASLYRAIDWLHHFFRNVPGFTKVALKAIQDNYTRSISIDKCMSVILRATKTELQSCVLDIQKALETLKPFKPKDFTETLLYAAVLTRTGNYTIASDYFKQLLASIPAEDRHEKWRVEIALIIAALEIENAPEDVAFMKLIETWKNLLAKLEKENDEQSKLRDFPPSFLFEN